MTMACSTSGDILQQVRMMLGAMERLLACAHCGQVLSDWDLKLAWFRAVISRSVIEGITRFRVCCGFRT